MSAHSRFLSIAVIASVVMASSGCVCVTNGGRGDIIFTWNMGGQTCAQAYDVTQVAIQIPGQTLQNQGVYGCVNDGTAGIKLLNFAPGTYDYTLFGQNAQGTVLYQATGKVTVNGDVALDVTLQPNGNAPGAIQVTATFPAGATVTCQYLAAVDISIDMGAPLSVQCNQATTSPGVLINPLSPGQHLLDVQMRDSNGLVYYRMFKQITVVPNRTTAEQVALEWLVGSVPVAWSFSNGVQQLNCSMAGINEVTITLRDGQGVDAVYSAPCVNGGVQGYQIPYAYYGDYQVFLYARAISGVEYYSPGARANPPGTPPSYRVTAGVFPGANTATPILLTP